MTNVETKVYPTSIIYPSYNTQCRYSLIKLKLALVSPLRPTLALVISFLNRALVNVYQYFSFTY
jgi:hypothetical protein